MKIAIPVKLNQKDPPVAPLFGKAKWFAIIQNGEVTIKANPANGGHEVVHWLASIGIDTLIIQEMGRNPFKTLMRYKTIRLFHSGFERILVSDVLKKLENQELTELKDKESIEGIIQHHEKRHMAHKHDHKDHHHVH